MTDIDPYEGFDVIEWMKEENARRAEREKEFWIFGDVRWCFSNQPIEFWEAHGLVCAITPGGSLAVNGYVQIPDGHSWRHLDLQSYEGPQLNVHGGITFGPHGSTGWVGFDTAHAYDKWERAVLRELRAQGNVSDRLWESWLVMWEHDIDLIGPQDRELPWTIPILKAEVENLARQIKEAT